MTDWTKALRDVVEAELAEIIAKEKLAVREHTIVSPNPESARRVHGTVSIFSHEREIRFYADVVDAISDCDVYREEERLFSISTACEEKIPAAKYDLIVSNITKRFASESYGILIARAVLHCDLIAARLTPMFSNPDFDLTAEVSRPGMLEEPRIKRWLT